MCVGNPRGSLGPTGQRRAVAPLTFGLRSASRSSQERLRPRFGAAKARLGGTRSCVDQSTGSKLMSSIFALHWGRFFGPVERWP